MRICYEAERVHKEGDYFVVETNAVPIRLWFLTDTILRIRAGFDGAWDEASYSLVMTAWESRTDKLFAGERIRVEPASAVVREEDDKTILEGKCLRVEIEKSPFRICIYDEDGTLLSADIPDLAYREDSNGRRMHSVQIEDDDHFYGFGEQTGAFDKREEELVLSPGDSMGYNAEKTEALYKHIPFYIKLMGDCAKAVGYFYHTTAECTFNMGRQKRNYWHRYTTFSADAGDVDFFLIAGPKIADVVRRYTDLTGKSAMLPRTALGYLGSSMYYSELPKKADTAILSFVETAKEEGIPMDGFQLSSGYCAVKTADGIKRCTFTWNKERFPNPKFFFREMERRGITVSANVKPGMLLTHPMLEEMQQKNMFVKASHDALSGKDGVTHVGENAIGSWWGGKGIFVDFTNPEARSAWKEYLKENLLEEGCPSVWNDNCEYDSIVDKDGRVAFEGKSGTIGALKSAMSNLMCKLSNEAMSELKDGVRPFSVCRSGHAGIQRYAQVWAGDNLTAWPTLRANIATILGMGLSGCSNMGCDIGGFYGPAPSAELLVRWVQNGIFQPRFSVHSTNTDNTVTEPWMYPAVKGLIQEAVSLRYQLSPYLYSLMAQAHAEGLPIMRPLVLEFQNDSRVYEEGDTFLLGDGLLVANVLEQGAQSRTIYFPTNGGPSTRFYDFWTRDMQIPGETVIVPVSLASIPLYVRSGAIIPFAKNKLMNLGRDRVTAIRILFAPDVDSEFSFYEDDGKTIAYEKGMFLKTRIQVTAGEKTWISFSREGDFTSSIQQVELDVIHHEKAPYYVQLAGRTLPHFLHPAHYARASEGWWYDPEKKSVQVKYARPKEDYTVLLSFEEFDLVGM